MDISNSNTTSSVASTRSPSNLTTTAADAAFVLLSNLTAFTSMAGCLLIFSVYWIYKEVRTTSRQFLVLLSCADFVVNVSTLLQTATYYQSVTLPSQTSFLCQTAAWVLVYSHVCTALWTVAITFYLFMTVGDHCLKATNRIVIFFHIFCWLMPLVVSLSADVAGVYGYNITDILLYKHPASCWIGNKVKNPLSWYFLTIEGWVIAAYCIVSLLYFAISWNVYCKKTKGKHISGDDIVQGIEAKAANEQLRFIPVIYVCTRIWGTGHFLFTHYPESRNPKTSDWIMVIKGIGDNSQGLLNAIFFCLATKQIRQLISVQLHKYCKCFSGWCSKHKFFGKERWMRVQSIVRVRARMPRRSRNLDGSDLDLSGISLELPGTDADLAEDDVIFER